MRRIGLSDGQPPPRGAALLLWAVATCARRLGLRRDRLLVLPALQTAAAHRSAARRALYPQNDRQRISVLERHRGGCAEGALRNALSMRSEEHTSELQSIMRISSAVFRLQ